MSANENGGPAFPRPHQVADANDPAFKLGSDGMALRDYFAAKAMQMHGAALSDMVCDGEDKWDSIVAARAYKTADAMLKERAK